MQPRQLNKEIRLYFILSILIYSCKSENYISDFQKFTGSWSLHIVESQNDSLSSWEPREDHYKNRKGFIIYDGQGGMGVHHVPENYEVYEFEGKGGRDSLNKKDLRHLANNFVYFGRYVVNDSLDIIEHHIKSSNNPSAWNTVAVRKYVFSKDTLILNPISDRYPKIRLKWIKVRDR